jgi:ribosomal protein L11 methyltransferase
MNWLEITVTVDAEAAEAVAETLSRYAPDGIAIEQRAREIDPGGEWSPDPRPVGIEAGGPLEPTVFVRAYLPMDAEIEGQRRQIEQALWHLRQIVPFPEPTFNEIKPEDWENAWKEHYHVLRVGSRFVIKPSWREHTPLSGDVVIELDPGMAFGTGLHPTTQMCLRAIERYLPAGARAIDLGTGSGILAIAAAKLGAASVLALDVDPVAVEAARENVRRNQVEGVVRVAAGSLNAARQTLRLRSGQAVDFALVNILAKTIIQLCDEGLAEIIDPGGLAAFAGLIDTQEDEVRETLARVGLNVIDRMQDKDWVGLVCRREAVRH